MPIDSLATYIAGLADLGKRPAIIERGLYRTRRYSYAQLIGKAFSFRDALIGSGCRPGDQVLIWGHSGAAWAIAFYGCLFRGAVAVPLDAAFSPDYVRRIQQHTQAARLCGDADRCSSFSDLRCFRFENITELPVARGPQTVLAASENALLEIVYTSGTTAEPKGVIITHGNLLANLRPIEAEVQKYRRKFSLFLPLVLPVRLVHLIPLSHLFGQALGLFIPGLIESTVVYPESQSPAFLADTIRRERASAMICVPQQLGMMSAWALEQTGTTAETVLARSRGESTAQRSAQGSAAQRSAQGSAAQRSAKQSLLARWWQWRKLHRKLGWKMWAFITGGASLSLEQEELWSAFGYAVIQGYGLTETAPAIAISHPFKLRRGAVGRKLAGVEVKIAADGEILVRGPNVSPGYFRNPEATGQAFSEGWLHTGDLGRLDDEGNLVFLGRSKETIVTSEGLNVYPSDVERELEKEPAVRESAAIAETREHRTQVHAVVAPAAGAQPADIEQAVARANQRLEPHQRIRAFSIWPEQELPRTPATHKLQRVAISAWVNRNGGAPQPRITAPTTWRQFLAQQLNIDARRLDPAGRDRLDQLGLSSLDRVELLAWAETHARRSIDERALSQAVTVADLEQLIEGGSVPADTATAADATVKSNAGAAAQITVSASAQADVNTAPPAAPPKLPITAKPQPTAKTADLPHWPAAPPVRWFRNLSLYALIFPLLRRVARVRASGLENLEHIHQPVLFIANHQSLLDVPVIVRALPARLRPWLASAAGADAFGDYLRPSRSWYRRLRAQLRYFLLLLFFNVYPLSDYTGIQNALRHSGWLADHGYMPLIFPEGARTLAGNLQAFRPGIGVFVRELQIPVVPIILRGVFEIAPVGAEHAHKGKATVTFGRPMVFHGRDAAQITAQLEDWFRRNYQPGAPA